MIPLTQEDVHRGATVAYVREPGKPLYVISDPYLFNGIRCVTARTMQKRKGCRSIAMYAIDALVSYKLPNELGMPSAM